MKKIYTIIIISLIGCGFSANAQSAYTLDWGTSFSTAWTAGSSTAHTTKTFGTSNITATVSFASPEVNALSSFAGFTSPQISSAGFPFNSQLGSNVSNLALGMDLASSSNYVDITITFSAPVNNVTFNIADIDKSANNSNTYYDEVLVTGVNGGTSVTNPTLAKLNGTLVNNTTDTVIISGNIAHSNTTSGRGGNTPSNGTDQNGTVTVNFGIVPLTSVTIRYRNTAGAQANPAQQAIGIGNINFQKASLLPVILNNFSAALTNNEIELDWQTSQELNSDKFIVEKSTDGINWQTIAVVAAAKNSDITKNYSITDGQVLAINYYRLKEVDADGSYTYSKVVKITKAEKTDFSVKIFPNPVTATATVTTSSSVSKTVHIGVFNSNGIQVKEITKQLTIGTNNIDIPAVSTLPNGMYTVVMSGNNTAASLQFIKQ